VSHTAAAETKRSQTQLAIHATRRKWSASDQPSWLTEKFYAEEIHPKLSSLSSSAIVQHLTVSRGYAAEIRRGRVPHPRHWQTLAKMTMSSVAVDLSDVGVQVEEKTRT
jgi:hypothetical protein